jgi:hypothetical protein
VESLAGLKSKNDVLKKVLGRRQRVITCDELIALTATKASGRNSKVTAAMARTFVLFLTAWRAMEASIQSVVVLVHQLIDLQFSQLHP